MSERCGFLVDIEPSSCTIGGRQVERALTAKTGAILACTSMKRPVPLHRQQSFSGCGWIAACNLVT